MNRRAFGRVVAGTLAAQVFPLRGLAQGMPGGSGVSLSVMLWTLEKVAPFDRCLEMVAAAGYHCVELVGEFHSWSVEERQEKLKQMRGLGLRVDLMSGMKAGFAVPEEREAFLTEFAGQLEAAKWMGCPQVNLKSGNRVAEMDPRVQFDASVEALKRAGTMAAEHGIEIVIEPIDLLENPTIYLTSVTEAFAMVDAVGSASVKVLYDFYHEQRGHGNLLEKLDGNIGKVGCVHVADVPGRHEPGSGEIDYAKVYERLAALKYDRTIAMEFYPQADPVAALRKAAGEVRAAFAAG